MLAQLDENNERVTCDCCTNTLTIPAGHLLSKTLFDAHWSWLQLENAVRHLCGDCTYMVLLMLKPGR